MKIDCGFTENFIKEASRMCGECFSCYFCPIYKTNTDVDCCCSSYIKDFTDEAIAAVQRWSDEHERKTYKEYFLEQYPNAPVSSLGYPKLRPCCLYPELLDDCKSGFYQDSFCGNTCWDKFLNR